MRLIVLLVFSMAVILANGQEVLTLEKAIQAAMQNNLGIKVVKNQQQQSENMATYGNAGLMPKLDAQGNGSYSRNLSNMEFAGGVPPIEDVQATSINYGANLQASYTLFNGFGSINTYKKLTAQADISAVQLKLSIESTILQVCNVYYEIARQQEQLNIAQNSLAISRERYKRAKVAQSYGTISSIDMLNAEVDMNADSSNVMNMRLGLNNAIRNLNVLLGKEVTAYYSVEDAIEFEELSNLDEVTKKAVSNNLNLLLAQSNIPIAEYDQKIQKAFYMPRVSVSASYGYSYSQSDASIVLNQSNLGFTGSAALAWNLFDGFKKKSAVQNAKIALETSQLKVAEAKLTVQRDLHNAYEMLRNNLELLELEKRSTEVAGENFERSKSLFNQGQLTTTEFRTAQLNLNRAKSRLNTTKFTTKMAEIELMRLIGELVK